MNGVGSTYEIWYLEEGRCIVSVSGPSGGCGDSRYVKIDVISAGSEEDYVKVLQKTVEAVKKECEENWG
jgi:hypothetical protein